MKHRSKKRKSSEFTKHMPFQSWFNARIKQWKQSTRNVRDRREDYLAEAAKLRKEWSDGNPGVALDLDSIGTFSEVDAVQTPTYEDRIGDTLWRCSTPASLLPSSLC